MLKTHAPSLELRYTLGATESATFEGIASVLELISDPS
jgi:hypothetical protein